MKNNLASLGVYPTHLDVSDMSNKSLLFAFRRELQLEVEQMYTTY